MKGSTRAIGAVAKSTDAKGRVNLGARYANRTVLIRHVSDTELVVQLARVVAEDELRLLRTPQGRL